MPKSGIVAIVGRPNAGKSTLLNAVLGSKVSIVTPKAQTTRERVLGILTEEAGQIVFVDTPGIHQARAGGINEFMVDEARTALEAPEVVWYLVDPSSALKHEQLVLEMLEKSGAPVLILLSKSDVVRGEEWQARLALTGREISEECARRGVPVLGVQSLSARENQGVAELLAATWARIPDGPPLFPDPDQISDRPVRFFVGEMIREQLLLRLGEELPYSCAVEIESFQEPAAPGGLTRVEAVIHVERESQKGMVVGKGGAKIREIGTHAREEIERFIGGKAFLGLRVKLLKDWSRDADDLRRLGYHLAPERKAGGKRGRGARG